MIEAGTPALKIYFFGFIFMTLQFAGQSAFTALKCSKRAVFFSIFRKVIIVVPLTLILPAIGYGVKGVFLAEPISNLVGGMAAFVTMYLTVYRKFPADGEAAHI
jgi:Na+-driven multidrug efflux pump